MKVMQDASKATGRFYVRHHNGMWIVGAPTKDHTWETYAEFSEKNEYHAEECATKMSDDFIERRDDKLDADALLLLAMWRVAR